MTCYHTLELLMARVLFTYSSPQLSNTQRAVDAAVDVVVVVVVVVVVATPVVATSVVLVLRWWYCIWQFLVCFGSMNLFTDPRSYNYGDMTCRVDG
jgi:hypothetical protein